MMSTGFAETAAFISGNDHQIHHLVSGAIIMIFPFLWMIDASLMTTGEIQARPPAWLPANLQFNNFPELLDNLPFGRFYLNSIFTTFASVIGVLLTSSLAGFAFAKYRFPGRELLFYMILATLMIPFFVTLIPVFYIVRQLHWYDNYAGLIMPGITSAYGIFLMRQFIYGIPDELIDAARIDGASEPLIYWRIVLPLTKPALATLGTFVFIGSWNSFLWPLLVVDSRDMYTVSLGLNTLRTFAAEARNLHLLVSNGAVGHPDIDSVYLLAAILHPGIALTGLKG
jgi:ABC-type glycerol-3-phosphate transport system permease component